MKYEKRVYKLTAGMIYECNVLFNQKYMKFMKI